MRQSKFCVINVAIIMGKISMYLTIRDTMIDSPMNLKLISFVRGNAESEEIFTNNLKKSASDEVNFRR